MGCAGTDCLSGASKPAEEQPPINLLDLNCTEPNVVPDSFCSQTMQFMSQLDLSSDAGRPVESVGTKSSLYMKTEKWHLLGQGGSGSLPHQDHCGLWTWVRVDQGRKLWLICHLSEDDRKLFAKEGSAFTSGQWFYLWLEPRDILIMPPGTVHAVFTPEDTLCTGGNGWSKKQMGDSMRSIAFEKMSPHVTNDDPIPQLADLLDKVSKMMESEYSAEEFGGIKEVENFNSYYEVCAFTLSSILSRPY
ncbi:MAG: hypothetical protein M1840_003371 [Geoglossum simile]|nr:MAG: hypothetical protein M1840_003371 [Geoglossum simile]